jgi:uncharacterized membrane protein YdbT with pleckstrin-like domain
MLRWFFRAIADPRVEKYLLVSEGERIEDEVRHHWVVYLLPLAECILALTLIFTYIFNNPYYSWPFAWIAIALLGHAGWKALNEHKDRFVVTNIRVFRVHGVLTQRRATMPIVRILDITVEKPFLGRIFGYGHFVFESAAQEQGVRDIRYVGDPDERDLTIQRVIQESGVRGPRMLR